MMKKLFPFRLFAVSCAAATMLLGCSKSNIDNSGPSTTPVDHRLGVLPMQPSDWANVPVFSKDVLKGSTSYKLDYSNTLPGSYLLRSPEIRDQGQIGSCTGFCGSESNEIIKYYLNNTSESGVSTDYTNAVSTALATQISGTGQTASYSGSSALSPLFLYFVERCVINNGSISTDNGAYMVNIGQALQGLSSNGTTTNTGKGKPSSGTSTLTYRINGTTYTFSGQSIESYYSYPWVTGSGGYNVASTSSGNFKTYPSSTAINNAPTYDIDPNNSNSNTSTNNVTTGGYYVINSSSIINDVKIALANNKPVMMGFNVYDDARTGSATRYKYFEGLNTTDYVYNPLDANGNLLSSLSLLGGHAVPIIGYVTYASDQNMPSTFGGGVFICQNSWGTPWGNNGYFLLPFNVLTNTKVVPAGNLYVLVK